MELAVIATLACGLTAVSVIVLGALAFIAVTTGGRGLIDRFGGMIGLGGSSNDEPLPQRERRVRPSGRSSDLRARAQNLSFDEAVQSQGGNVPANNQRNQQSGGNDFPPMQQQSFSAQAAGLQPSRPALSPSRPFQGASSSGGTSQRNQQQQRQAPQGNWGDTLGGQRAGQQRQQSQPQRQQPRQQGQRPQQQRQQQQRQDPLQPSLRGGQQWQGNWGDTLNPQRAQQPQQNQNQPQQTQQQNRNQQQNSQRQQQGGLGDYRPQLRATPGASTQQQTNRWNRGRDSRKGDDYDRVYDDGDGGFFEDG